MTCRKCVLAIVAAAVAGSATQTVLAQGYYGPPQAGYADPYGPPPGYGYNQQQSQYPYGTPPAVRCEQKRDTNTAAGGIIGAIAGGLLGNSVSGHDRGAGTAIGAIAGGLLGASVGRSLSCNDQQYAYNVYYSGFEAGRPHHRYEWRSPYSDAHGYMEVRDYYTAPEGYRCANYEQQIFVNGRPEVATGHACRRPDGTWQMVG